MHPYKSKKGLSAIVIIIIILVIGAIGAGGYFGYTIYLEPTMNPYSKLIPSELKPYAMGKTAEAFVVIKNDEELKEAIIKSSPESAEQVNSFEAAIAVVSTTRLSGAIVILFSTAEKAAELKILGESQVQSGPVTFTFQQKDKVLIASFGGGLDAMGGPLLENPGIQKLDRTMLDSQLIAYAATSQMGTLGDLIGNSLSGAFSSPSGQSSFESAIFPSAHAQGTDEPKTFSVSPYLSGGVSSSPYSTMSLFSSTALLPFINDTTLYIRYKNMVFDIQTDISFLEKNTLASAPLIKNYILKDEKIQISDLEKTYDTAFSQITVMTGEWQKFLDEQTKAFPGSTAKLSYDSLKLSLTINFPSEIAEKQVQGLLAANLSAPAKDRDAARKANLSTLTTAIETYNLEKGGYPMPSACLEDMEKKLSSYLANGKIPEEVKGYELKMENCESNYFYQYFGDKGYILWTKMDLPADGNISITPADFEKAATAGNVPATETSGTYYMLNKSYFSTSGVNSNPLKLEPLSIEETPDSFLSEDFTVDARPADDPKSVEFNLNIAPGKTAQTSATVLNYSKQSGTVSIYAADKSTEKFAKMKKPGDPNSEVGLWTTVDKTELSLAPKETQTVNFTVSVPQNTAPGKYQGQLIFRTENPGMATSSALTITVNVAAAPVKKVKRTP